MSNMDTSIIKEQILAGGLRDIARAGLGEEETKSLALECAQRNPDAVLVAISGDKEGIITDKQWSADVFKSAVDAGVQDVKNIFDAFARVKQYPLAVEVFGNVAKKYPEATLQHTFVYADLPNAGAIFDEALQGDGKVKYYGALALINFRNPSVLEAVLRHAWLQERSIKELEAGSFNQIVSSAQFVGEQGWFKPLLDKLPQLVKTANDLALVKQRLEDSFHEYPRAVVKEIISKLGITLDEGRIKKRR